MPKQVHSLSVASERETQRLTRRLEAGERVCVAYFTTPNGGIFRQPPPWRRWVGALQSGLALLLPFGATSVRGEPPLKATEEHREARLSANGEIVMGKVAAPTPTPHPPVIRGEAVAVPNAETKMGMPNLTTSTPKLFVFGDAILAPGRSITLETQLPTPPQK